MRSILLLFLFFIRIVSCAAQSLNDYYDTPPRSPIKPPRLSPPQSFRPPRPPLTPPPLSPPDGNRPSRPPPTAPRLSPPGRYRPPRPPLTPPPLSPPDIFRPPRPPTTPPRLSPPRGYRPPRPPRTPPRLSPPDDLRRPPPPPLTPPRLSPPARFRPPRPPLSPPRQCPPDGSGRPRPPLIAPRLSPRGRYRPPRPPLTPPPLSPPSGYRPPRTPPRSSPPIPPQRPPQKDEGHHFEHHRFKLSLQWPNSYCFSNDINDCRPTVPQYFTINGLWAEKHIDRGRSETQTNCSASDSLTDDTIDKHKYELLKFWPDLSTYSYEDSKEMWKQQWKKYGSCGSDVMSPEPYIESALKLRKAYNMLQILKSGGILPNGKSYKVDKILTTAGRGLRNVVDIVCGSDRVGSVFLLEINVCVSNDGTHITDCDGLSTGCEQDPIFPDPVFT